MQIWTNIGGKMDAIYAVLEFILPFEFIDYTFMKNALLAIILITPIFAILGTMIVNNKMAFFSDALGHSALTGIAIGMLLGISNINISMIFFAVIFALLLNFIKNKTTYGADTIISVFSSIAIALGLAILAQTGSFNKYSSYLVGDILSINSSEILYLFISFIAVILFWYFMFNKLNVVSINKTLAKSRRINIKLIDNIFVVLIAVIVMISIRWIGILLINSLLILPAAASRNIAKSMRSYHLLSIIFSVFSGICGLILSYYWNIPTGPMIVIISGIIYFATFAKKLVRKN
jgi:zinc transport system permease protein